MRYFKYLFIYINIFPYCVLNTEKRVIRDDDNEEECNGEIPQVKKANAIRSIGVNKKLKQNHHHHGDDDGLVDSDSDSDVMSDDGDSDASAGFTESDDDDDL